MLGPETEKQYAANTGGPIAKTIISVRRRNRIMGANGVY